MATDDRQLPFILGLTGPIACGKTTVGTLLLELGALDRIDADTVVHDLYAPGTQVTAAVAGAFPGVLAEDGSVDRSVLAEKVFGHQESLRRLEGIVHPAVRATIRDRLEHFRGRRGLVVIDAVRLLQSDLLPLCDAVWLVTCDRAEQERRLRENRRMSDAAVRDRLDSQPTFDSPRVSAVIPNSGSRADLAHAVRRAWEALGTRGER